MHRGRDTRGTRYAAEAEYFWALTIRHIRWRTSVWLDRSVYTVRSPLAFRRVSTNYLACYFREGVILIGMLYRRPREAKA